MAEVVLRPLVQVYLVVGYDWDDVTLDSVWTEEDDAQRRSQELQETQDYDWNVVGFDVNKAEGQL